jgi:A/G-specific adenine glycosylase
VTDAHLALLNWYERHGRAHLPWRVERDPYYTLVSEFMLQQTQVDRVVPKFQAFVKRFPDIGSLAPARSSDVLRAWQGLGYNSRAVRLHRLAKTVTERFEGTIPRDPRLLRTLPGVGAYTVAAIRAFAYDEDEAPVDTNVRRIVHRLCFGVEYPPRAPQRDLDARARELVPPGRAHDWNSALMDLGAILCTARTPKCLLCPLQGSCAAAPIDAGLLDALRNRGNEGRVSKAVIPFKRTMRYARGRIIDRLRALPAGERISLLDLHRDLAPLIPERSLVEIRALVKALARDGLVEQNGDQLALAD